MIPQVLVATVTLDARGTFQVPLPDFESDPVIAKSKGVFETSGNFWLFLRDPQTLNHIAALQPEIEEFRTPGKGLKLLSAYPSELTFVPLFSMQ